MSNQVTTIDKQMIRGWEDINKCLFDDTFDSSLNRWRSKCLYRGHNHILHKLEPGLYRSGGHYMIHGLEKNLLNNFSKYSEYSTTRETSVWRRLAVAQHHGLPTRLLDWTYSPYVALHFATDNADLFDKDGCIWCIDVEKSNRYLPPTLKKLRAENAVYMFTVDHLDQACRDLSDFDMLSHEQVNGVDHGSFVAFYEPPSIDDRIINQFGMFSIASHEIYDLQTWLDNKPNVCKKIIIPADLKREIRDKIDQSNINERVLFPGLDGLCKWLKRYYGPS